MSHLTTLNPGVGGDTASTTDIAIATFPTTGKAQNVVLYVGATSTTAATVCTKANPLFAEITDGTNVLPTMDAAARPGFVKLTDGTNTAPTMDAAARAGFIKLTDGTNTAPTMDAAARPGFVKLTDGTGTQTFDNSNTTPKVSVYGKGTAAGDTSMPSMDTAAHAGFVKLTDGTNTAPTGDAIARSIFVRPGDGTNGFLSGTAANLAAQTALNAVLTTLPGCWGVFNQATAGTPTISKAAGGAGVRHTCNAVSISVAAGATAQTPVIVNLRDGATGVGTILRTWALAAPVNGFAEVNESGLNLVGTANTAMTIEFAGATAAAVVGSVNLAGFSGA